MRTSLLQLDFRRRPGSHARWLGWCLLAAAVVAAVGVGMHYAAVHQQHAFAQARMDRLNARVQAARPRPASNGLDPQAVADLKRANAIIDQLTVPWDPLFDAIEAADPRGLGVLSLTPNARERTVQLAGESRSMADLLAYVDRAAAQPVLGQVHLVRYSTVQRDGLAVVSFALAATWKQSP